MGGTNRNISVRAVGDFSNLSQGLRNAQNEIQSFGDRVKSKFAEIGEVGRGIKDLFEVFKEVAESVGELANRAAELDGGMSSLNRTLGESAVGYMDWANSTAKSFGISKMSAIEYGKSIAMLLGDVYKDQGQLAAATEQLMQGGAVIAAKTGKSQQEVYEELNSALMGHSAAVKSLDINIMENALVHSQAYKQIANGTPWAQLTAEQQQYIRVTELNRQIQQKFGDTIGNGMDARLMLFKGALDDLKTGLAEAFMPILYKVLPILTTFLGWIQTAINYVAAFFQVLFGYSGIHAGAAAGVNQHAAAVSALGDAYASAGKKASAAHSAMSGGAGSTPKVKTSGIGGHTSLAGGKKVGTGFTASFDQVHTIPEKTDSSSGSGSGAGGSSGGVGAGGVPDMAALANGGGPASGVADNLEKLREKVAGFANGVKTFFGEIGKFLAPVGKLFMEIWGSISSYFQGVVMNLEKWWNQWGSQIIQGLKNVWAILSPIVVFIVQFIWDSIKGAIDGCIKFFEGLIEFLTGIFTGNWKAIFQGLWDMIKGGLQAVWNIFNIIFLADGISAIKKFAVDGLKALVEFFAKGIDNAKGFLSDMTGGFTKMVKSIIDFFKNIGTNVDNFYNGTISTLEKLWKGIPNGAKAAWQGFKDIFVDAANWFARVVVTPIINAFNNIINGFKTGGLLGGIKAVLNTYFDYINSFIKGVNSVIHLIPNLGNVNIPTIPHLARGGITNGPTYALIGDNAGGQEVVSPLNKLQDYMASTITNAIMTAMSMQNGKRNSVAGDIILNIDGKQFARIIKPYADLENKRVGTNVRLQSL